MERRIVSFGMYVDPLSVPVMTARLWSHVRDSLRAGGLADVPDAVDDTTPLEAAWLDPGLLLAQTCGYPFVKRLRGHVRLVATPVYDHPGCIGALGGSFIVVRADEPGQSIADFAGHRAAINDPMSNTGCNLLRAAVAPHANGRAFFSRVVETGSHRASMAAVAAGTADIAAIDCVTWGNIGRHAPEQIERLRTLCETLKTPGLPLITRASASDAEIRTLREALNRAAADPAMREVCAALGLRGFATLADDDYDVILNIERDAITLGYPAVA